MRNVHSCWVKCIFGSANKYLQSTILVSFQLNAFIVQKKVVKPATTCNQIPKLAKILMTFPRKEAVLNEFAASLYSAVKVLYTCASFWLFAHESHDLSPSEI